MRFLGIDPGYSLLGFGIVDEESETFSLVKAGVIDTSSQQDFNQKLVIIYSSLSSLISEYKPDMVCVEEIFFGKNVKTGMKVAQMVGVVKLAVLQKNITLVGITPSEVKRLIVGSKGKHPKVQIQNLVRMLLRLNEIPKPDDCADAIAVAIAGASKARVCRVLPKQL
ncbi:MAG: crossover junction endodeoxyribonuclease RuvC [Brevinematia bacterium]